MRGRIAGAALAAVLLAAPSVYAQCEDHAVVGELRRGVRLRQQRHDVEALALFESLWRRCGDAQALAQMGQAEVALERWAEAHAHIEEALSARSNHAINRLRGLLEESLRETERHLVAVRVRSSAPGALLQIDDAPARPLAAVTWVTPGSHALRVSANGYRAESQTLTLAAGTTFDTSIDLRPEEIAPPPPPPPPPPPLQQDPPVRLIERRSPLRVAGIITLSAGASALLASGVFGILYQSDYDASGDPDGVWWRFTDGLSDAQRASAEAACQAAIRGSMASEYCTTAERHRALAIALLVGGGVAAVTGFVLAIRGRPTYERAAPQPSAPRVTFAPFVSGTARGATASWTF